MKISLITAAYNSAGTIAETIESVLSQSYPNIEYILVDGMSSDGTDAVVTRYLGRIARSIREPDSGIYDALNKGISVSTGEVIGFLHADDVLADNSVIQRVADRLEHEPLDGVYGDLMYVDSENLSRVHRYWKAGPFEANNFRWGWMPPHPTVYLRREVYGKYGSFRTDFRISSDYELMLRMMVRHRIRMGYMEQIMVKMRVGGLSNASLKNRLLANNEDRRAWSVNDLKTPFGLRWIKPARKLSQFWRRADPQLSDQYSEK